MLKTKRTPRTDKRDTKRTDTGRRTDGHPVKLSGSVSGAPRWVGWFTDIGRPLSAMVVMVLCAPGERHLAELAGWGPTLSWGMAGLLVMYAGIAAVVATVRPKGAPGKITATIGAVISLLLAMAAQPVSHYFVTGWMQAQPRAPFWLVTIVSCVPPFVMGHLLHLAADPGGEKAADAPTRLPEDYPEGRDDVPTLSEQLVNWARENSAPDAAPATSDAVRRGSGISPDTADTPDDYPWADASTWSADTPDTGATYPDVLSAARPDAPFFGHGQPVDMRTYGDPDTAADAAAELSALSALPAPDAVPGQRTDVADIPVPDADTDMGTFIRDTWTLNPDMTRTDMRTVVRRSFPDKKADAVRKAVARADEGRK